MICVVCSLSEKRTMCYSILYMREIIILCLIKHDKSIRYIILRPLIFSYFLLLQRISTHLHTIQYYYCRDILMAWHRSEWKNNNNNNNMSNNTDLNLNTPYGWSFTNSHAKDSVASQCEFHFSSYILFGILFRALHTHFICTFIEA